ncbi:hypothetical protein LVJ94_28090 [Pendulispora rubella]|uniref:Uncharacterized protein n=1 Tax=Pendulispora rubella TaxID=2741070 RepID=A0ABZ2KQ55_9BACT
MTARKRRFLYFVLFTGTAACVSSAPTFDFGDGGPGQPGNEAGPTEAGSETGTDAPITDAGPPPCNPKAPFQRSPNQPFQKVNTANAQVGASLSPDELTVYYDDNRTLFTATRTEITKAFENAHPLPIEGDAGCAALGLPAVTRDEKRVFFQCSNDGEATAQIRSMVRNDKGAAFGNVAEVIFHQEDKFKWFPRVYESQGRIELWSSITAAMGSRDGDEIYQLVSTDGGGGFGAAIPRDDLNAPDAGDSFPVLTPDGLQVYFASGRDHLSNADIYVATRQDVKVKFQTPTRVAALSDDVGDDGPNWISPDGCRMYYFSGRAGGAGSYDLYLAERAK